MLKLRSVFVLIILISAVLMINSEESALEDKVNKDKLMACMNLSKARVTNDEVKI